MDMRNYIIVTPCKNEEENLPKLAVSLINQTIPPKVWVIVDDGSSDRSYSIIQNLSKNYSWIKCIELKAGSRDLGVHVSHVYRSGFNYAINYCNENNINFEYIGVVDADIILDNAYFENLIAELEKNPNLGVCSGLIGNIVDGDIIYTSFREDLPSGGARLWRKQCFEETGGYLLTCCPDSISNVKAKLKGWDTRKFGEIVSLSSRPYASAEGQWNGYKKLGANNYFIGYNPLHVILKSIFMLYSRNNYFKCGAGIAYSIGYFKNYLKRSPRIKDKEILRYYKYTRIKEILCQLKKSPKKEK
jgi:glycosyltransferase involved in cell wall biosynthesis